MKTYYASIHNGVTFIRWTTEAKSQAEATEMFNAKAERLGYEIFGVYTDLY